MPDAFISYSRRDSEFVGRLVASLEERGQTVWLDTEGIADGEVFPRALRLAIEQSDAFVFVITPDALASDYCEQEVDHARGLGKRIVPVLRRPVSDGELHAEIRDRNWIPFVDDGLFDGSIKRLVTALEFDGEGAKAHTRWLLKALEWDGEGRDRSFLLRGAELAAAEGWLSQATGKDPAPTALQSAYVLGSRAAASRRQRVVAATSGAVALVSAALLVFALISRSNALSAQAVAASRALAAESENQLGVDPELSVLLAREAVGTKDTPEALFALRGALDSSPLRKRLPEVGRQECGLARPFPYAAYTPDGRAIVEVLCNGTVLLLRRSDGQVGRRLRLGVKPTAAALSPDGRQLAVGTSEGVSVIDLASGAPRATVHAPAPAGLAFRPDGRQLAIGVERALLTWNIGAEMPRTLDRLKNLDVTSLAFTPDGRRLITAANSLFGSGRADVYKARSGAHERRLGGRDFTGVVAVNPDGRELAIASTDSGFIGRVDLWSTRSWRRLRTVARTEGEATAVAFSPDGRRLAVGVADGTVGLWSLGAKERIVELIGHKDSVPVLAFSPNGTEMLSTSANGAGRVWMAGAPEQRLIDDQLGAGALAFGNRLTASIAGAMPSVLSWRAGDFRGLRKQRLAPSSEPASPLLSPDGELVALPTDHALQVRATTDGDIIVGLPPTKYPFAATFTDDASRIAVLDQVRMYTARLKGSKTVGLAGPRPPCTAGWRAATVGGRGGRLIAGGTYCGDVVIWDAVTGRRLTTFRNVGQVSSMDFIAGGKTLAVASWDTTVTLWDVARSRPRRVLRGHTGGIEKAVASPDGRLLVTASLDETARLWEPVSGRTLRVLRHPRNVYGVAFSPDGNRIATVDDYGALRVWDTCPGCGSAERLLKMSESRITRGLTALERDAYVGGD